MFFTTPRWMIEGAATTGSTGFGFQFHDEPDDFEVDVALPEVDSDNSQPFGEQDDDPDSDLFKTKTSGDTDKANVSTPDSKTAESKVAPAPYKPYEFKGKVSGEDVVQKFETQKDLDRTLANGLLAPKIYEAFTSLKKEAASLKSDAEWAQGLVGLAKENPAAFFDHVANEMVDERDLALWVHKKYHEFESLARMSPDQLQMHRNNKAAEKLLREQAYNEELAAEAREQQEKALVAQEKVQFEAWRTSEINKWQNKLPETAQKKLPEIMELVAARALRHIDAGREYSYKRMSQDIAGLLSAYVPNTQSPAASKREELANVQNRQQTETEKLRQMGSRQAVGKPQNPNDVWNNAARIAKNEAAQMKQNRR
jgi:hypothetical protein